jgi:glycosyltransferase involved in cell wall biosynthesis
MGAPWPMLREHGCGWWVDTTVDGLDAGLRQATSCDRKTLQAMGARGRAWVSAEFRWEHIANEFLSTYQQVRNSNVSDDNPGQIKAIHPPR